MADERLRELERRFRQTGVLEDEVAYLLGMSRTGDLAAKALHLERTEGIEASLDAWSQVLYETPDNSEALAFLERYDNPLVDLSRSNAGRHTTGSTGLDLSSLGRRKLETIHDGTEILREHFRGLEYVQADIELAVLDPKILGQQFLEVHLGAYLAAAMELLPATRQYFFNLGDKHGFKHFAQYTEGLTVNIRGDAGDYLGRNSKDLTVNMEGVYGEHAGLGAENFVLNPIE